MEPHSHPVRKALNWLKEWWSILALIGALFTGAYYWDDVKAAQNANDIARLTVTPKIKIVAAEVSYGIGLNKAFLQQMSSRRIVIRLANIGSVQTSLTEVEFNGFAKALSSYNLAKQAINFRYGKPTWEPFNGSSAYIWNKEIPDFTKVIHANLRRDPWKLENDVRVSSHLDSDSIEKDLKQSISSIDEAQFSEEIDDENIGIAYSTIPGSNLPIIIPANSTIDVVVDILVRNRASVNDIYRQIMREIKVLDRGFKGDLIFRFPDSDPVVMSINEPITRASLSVNEHLLRSCGCPYYIVTYKEGEGSAEYYKIAAIR